MKPKLIFNGAKITASFLSLVSFFLFATAMADEADSWSLTSPNGQCEISVLLNDGKLNYEVSRDEKIVIKKSALGLQRDDQNFETELIFENAGKIESHREKYQLFGGDQPRVNHVLNFRSLKFENENKIPIEIDLAASDEGVAFRYSFAETNNAVHVVESELTSFTIPQNARGWMQPYHAAGPYTPAYEDFYFPVSAGDPPPDSCAKAVGWAFPALFRIPGADTWVLLTESGTDKSYCACHLNPDCSQRNLSNRVSTRERNYRRLYK